MTTITVSNAAQLNSALASAVGGDTISLAAGNYGDIAIYKAYASDITITSQSLSSPAVFNSLNLSGAGHVHIDDVAVQLTPTATTYSWSPALQINNSSNITISHSTVTGGPAVNGVAQSATTLDNTGNVIGLATGYGINILSSNGVKIDGVEVSNFYKGIVLNKSTNLTISHDDIHNIRTTGIVGAEVSNVTIDSNHIHDSNPWHWGSGDHADFLALWTNSTQTAASTNIKITNNLMEQGQGTAVLGMWMAGGTAGFSNVTISGNAILDGNFQGITLWDTSNATVDHNTLLQTSGVDFRGAPGILLSSGTHNVSVTSNLTGSYNDQSGSTGALANTASANTLMQKWAANVAGYYDNSLILSVEAAHDISGLYGLVGGIVVTSPTPTPTPDPIISVVSPTPVASPTPTPTPTPTPAPTPTPTPTATTTTTTTDSGSVTPAGLTITGSWDYTTITGSSGADTITSRSGGDTLVGGAGNDTYYFTASNTTVIEVGGGGVDTIVIKGDYVLPSNVENLVISNTAVNGWSGAGNELNNSIIGNDGGNYLSGAGGADTIDGRGGLDVIIGGAGDDRLIGGAGRDTFRFNPGSGHDTIVDMSKIDHDSVDISGFLKVGLAPTVTDVGTDVKISFANGDYIVLTGVHAKDLIATSTGFTV